MHDEMLNRILLAQSGELSPADEAELQDHLAGCEPCRRYREELARITAEARLALPAGTPSSAALDAVRAEARKRAGSPRLLFRLPVMQALSCAAAVLILLAGWMAMTHGSASEPMQDFEAILAVAAEPHPSALVEPQSTAEKKEARLEALARQLLHMEGLTTADDLGLLGI